MTERWHDDHETWLPTFLLKERGLSAVSTGGFLIVTITGSFFGYLAGAIFSDLLGRRLTFLFFGLSSFFMILVYTFVNAGDTVLLLMGLPLGFFLSASFAVMPAFFTETFPTHCRGTGLGFVTQFWPRRRCAVPFLVGLYSEQFGLGFTDRLVLRWRVCLYVALRICAPQNRRAGFSR